MTFQNRDEFRDTIVNVDHPRFVSHYLFESVPFIFAESLAGWISWKTQLGDMIEVDPRNIVLTGSAALGFSLSPGKDFRKFGKTSDIDCGIISPHHFDLSWRYLRQRRTDWLILPRPIKDAIASHMKNYVFSGAIATDRILSLLPFGAEWQAALNTMSSIDPTVGREVKLRIYKDFDALRGYQMVGLREAKARILDTTKADDDSEISTEDE